MQKRNKIAIIGAGNVGSTLAHILATTTHHKIYLYDKDIQRTKGVLLDIFQSSCVSGNFGTIDLLNYPKGLEGCDIVVITAGMPRLPGMSRDDLLLENAKVITQISKDIKQYAPHCTVILVTNPLDAMVYVALRQTEFTKNKIIGMAGVLDSGRMASFIYENLQYAPNQIFAPVMGGHGDDMVPLTRFASVNGIPLIDLLPKETINSIVDRTKNAGAEIVGYLQKGSAYFAPAQSVAQMIEAIITDSKKIFSCAVLLQGEYGYNDIVGGVPVQLGLNGIEKIVDFKLNDNEKQQFAKSMHSVQELIDTLKKEFL